MPKNVNINVAQNLIDIVNDAQTILTFVEFKPDSSGNYLEMVLTNEGVCYQFNGLNHQDIYKNIDYITYNATLENYINVTGNWSLDDGYQNYSDYPKRTSSSSISSGFYLYSLRLRRFNQGFKVFINSPDNIPLTTDNYYIMVPDSKQVIVTVLPQYIKTPTNLKDFDIDKRQCYFNKERNLRFFKFYTQNNCQTECLTNYTIAKCGCAKFWMPKPTDIPFCDITQLACCSKASQELDVILTNQTIKKTRDPKVKIMCDCKPACNSLEYNFEITQGYVNINAYLKASRLVEDAGDDYIESDLIVHYKESQFTAIKRTVIYDRTQFIANCGAIFGLFMGGSIISLIEFIYFFSLRLFNNYRRRLLIQKKLKQLEIEIFNSP
ncbi:Pickpocket protein 28 [Lucilia cuprina]|nr:Pickpocket protein 28 [Lucilia cuprina]